MKLVFKKSDSGITLNGIEIKHYNSAEELVNAINDNKVTKSDIIRINRESYRGMEGLI